ncbi:MAG: hypothetical protein J6U18_06375 [Acetobacter sp.]|nr:hypothetical protein [Acetobacter sp.]
MGFWEELGASLVKVGIESLTYHSSYTSLTDEIESENPNWEKALEKADTFLSLVKKGAGRHDEEIQKKVCTAFFAKGCSLLALERKEGFESLGEVITNYRGNTDSEIQKLVQQACEIFDELSVCPRCGSCNVKKTVYQDNSMAASAVKNTVGYGTGLAGGGIGAIVGTAIFPGVGTVVGAWAGHALGSIGGSTAADEAMKQTVRECPDCGYEF